MTFLIDTCVLPRCRLEAGRVYRDLFGPSLGFELLMMFDLPAFEENLRQNLDLFTGCPLQFHEPVFGVEHTEPKGSPGWEESMYHIRLTRKYAEILHPASMVYHFSNCRIPPWEKEKRLRTSLENLDEIRDLFPDAAILVENTGLAAEGTLLLDQAEFTDLCRDRRLPVLVDVGHACANRWNIPKLLEDLRGQVGGFHLHNNDGVHDLHARLREGRLDFLKLVPLLDQEAPDVPRVIEYTRPSLHGDPLLADLEFLMQLSESGIPQGEK